MTTTAITARPPIAPASPERVYTRGAIPERVYTRG